MSKEPGDHRSGTRACSHECVSQVSRQPYSPTAPTRPPIAKIVAPSAPVVDQFTYSINAGSENVQKPLRDQPRQTHLLIQLLYAEDPNAMEDGDNSAQAHSDEHESAERPPSRRAELREEHDNGGR
jgi:hypothetical protein